MTSHPRIPRRTQDLVDSLKQHLKLLREFSIKAFHEGDQDYLGEVAGKLRVLIYERGRNTALLLSLMDEFDLQIPITLGGPPIKPEPGKPGPGDKISLREYLSLTAYGIRTQSGFVELNKHDLIGIWAQENGAAHEDWSLDEPYSVARSSGIFIGGHSALAAELKITTKTILHVGERCLEAIDPKFFQLKDAERNLRANPDSEDAKNDLGIALANLGEYPKALQAFDDVVGKMPNYVKAHNNRGLVLLHLNHLADAATAFQRAIELEPNYSDALYNLACVYSRAAEFSKSLDLLTRVKELDRFKGNDPLADPDLAGIRNDAEYGLRFKALLQTP